MSTPPAIPAELASFLQEAQCTLSELLAQPTDVVAACLVDLSPLARLRVQCALDRARAPAGPAPPSAVAPPAVSAIEAGAEMTGHVCPAGLGADGTEALWMVKIKPLLPRRPPIRFSFVVDNSFSMGRNTQNAVNHLAPLLDLPNVGRSSLVVFHEAPRTLSTSLTSSAQMRAVRLPQQGRTNITAAVATAVENVIAADDGAAHQFIILLTDGAHNEGPPLTAGVIEGLKGRLVRCRPDMQVSVVVIGVTAASETRLGMDVKLLEMNTENPFELIYFAATLPEMVETIQELTEQVREMSGHATVCISGGDRPCIRDAAVGPAPSVTASAAPGAAVSVMFEGRHPPAEVWVDGRLWALEAAPADADGTLELLTGMLRSLRPARVRDGETAGPVLLGQAERLKMFLVMYERLVAARGAGPATGGGDSLRSAVARLRTLRKATRGATLGAAGLVNDLQKLLAFNSTVSSDQAAFLTGGTRSGAATARDRAAKRGDGDSTVAVRADLARLRKELPELLRQDTVATLCRMPENKRRELSLSPATRGLLNFVLEVGPAMPVGDTYLDAPLRAVLDVELPAALDALCDPVRSWLSMQTYREHLQEFVDGLDENTVGSAELYSLLCLLGVPGHQVVVVRSDATQNNPYQMTVPEIRVSVVDTASVLTALRSDTRIAPPEGGKDVRDVLPLIDPAFPRASRRILRSPLFDALHSVIFCEDLDMFLGNEQRMALHAHGLVAAAADCTEAAMVLALKIAYSARMHLGASADDPSGRYAVLVARLLAGEPLTEAAGVDHVYQLVLAMTMLDYPGELSDAALANLYSEAMSRAAREELRGELHGVSDIMREEGHRRVAALLGVAPDNSPCPTSFDEDEPEASVVEEGCSDAVTLCGAEAEAAVAIVEGRLKALRQVVVFCKKLHRYAVSRGGMQVVCSDMEDGKTVGIARFLMAGQEDVSVVNPVELYCQAFLFHTSATRTAVAQAAVEQTAVPALSVLPAARLLFGLSLAAPDLSVLARWLRVTYIYMPLRQTKMKAWSAAAGDVLMRKARGSTPAQWKVLIAGNGHVHERVHAEFWALAAYAKRKGGEHERIFLAACNVSFAGGKRYGRL